MEHFEMRCHFSCPNQCRHIVVAEKKTWLALFPLKNRMAKRIDDWLFQPEGRTSFAVVAILSLTLFPIHSNASELSLYVYSVWSY